MSRKILIADSGSTKTDWMLADGESAQAECCTQGINPYMIEAKDIAQILREELLCDNRFFQPDEVYFYGAGCRGEQTAKVQHVLAETLQCRGVVAVSSDLLGAARSVLGSTAGIACILGTGSNSCLYDGVRITSNVSPLGFILGDEGSGATLGRRLVGDVCKQQLPENLCNAFFQETALTPDIIIQRVYKQPFPNRFLASLVPFLARHCHEEAVHTLLVEEFSRFFMRNISLYDHPELSVNFVGSIAYHFANEVCEAGEKCGYSIGQILQKPLPELAKFHTKS